MIDGFVAPGFEPVAEAFAESFEVRGEVGAAFAATRDGRPVVDLWGGLADRDAGSPWREQTLQPIFSGTKGLTALCVAILVERERLALEAPVSAYWPEFAVNGKDAITVAEVLSHRARLPGVRTAVDEVDVLDPRRMADLLARQAPEADPRAAFVYHPLTWGWLCGELVRRVDGRSLGRFFAEEVAGPLGLELWIGLPPELEPRVAVLVYAAGWGTHPAARPDAFPGDALWASIWANPPWFWPHWRPWNLPAWHAAEIPAANAIGTARSIARLYGALACGGELDGTRVISAAALAQAVAPLATGLDPFAEDPTAIRFAAGFRLQGAQRALGPPEEAFGHGGTGGSVHGAWPRERVGFSYAMNELRDDTSPDERSRALLAALHRCLH